MQRQIILLAILAKQFEANHNKDYSVVKTFKAGHSSPRFLFVVSCILPITAPMAGVDKRLGQKKLNNLRLVTFFADFHFLC